MKRTAEERKIRKAKKKAKSALNFSIGAGSKQGSLIPKFENLCADWNLGTTYSKRVKLAAKWCVERHLIFIRKNSGEKKPWTQDPILQSYRFTNVYREVDRVTEEIMDEWVKPNIDNRNIGLIALTGRLINYTNTLVKMRDAGFDYTRKPNNERLFALYNSIRKTKEQLCTGAYIVNTIFPKGFEKIDGSKADYLANFFALEAWSHRDTIATAVESGSFTQLLDAYTQVHGIGKFIANQAAVDLTYTGHIDHDIEGSWSPGPGTMKGIKIITQNPDLRPGTDETMKALDTYLEDLNNEISRHKLFSANNKKMKTNIVPISTPNASNTLCEVSKYAAMVLGSRDRMKNTYKGA